ncbi:MAG: prepilin peptidase [Gemmatimonadales bacterium]|nr:prepilin peptidase [Gemmatimonadales bacterium]
MPIDPLVPEALVIGLAAVLGAVLGSFLNVCILRWGAEPKQSVVHPPSRCPGCGHQIRWYENIPILSWLALRGRCSGCGSRISPLYPAVELATALLWAGSVALLGPTLTALELAVASTILVGIAVSDARAYIIPHELSLGGTAMALAFAAYPDFSGVAAAVQGALFGAGLILLVGELTELALGQEAMGGGDCALMGMVGGFFGWELVLPVVALGALISLVLYTIVSLLPRPAAHDATEAADEGETGGMRWGKLFTLLSGGVVLLGLMMFALSAGVLGPVVLALFDGVLGAGAAYYLSLVLPERAFRGTWPGVRGLMGAAVGIGVGAGLSPTRIAVGAVAAAAALWAARRVEVAASPETTEELSSGGYIPFGVGLALAAGLLGYTGGAERMRQAFAELAPALGLG